MATNNPAQPPAAPDVLVRGSEEYKEYMRQGGRLSGFVNGLEKRLATSGRTLLLIFIIYATIQGTLLIGGVHTPFLLDVIMLSFQVAGLEGSIPGLTRLREEMLTQRRHDDAREILGTIKSSRVLNLLTGVEIVLGTHPVVGGFSTTDLASWYAGVLLLLRLYYITKFLGTMSRMESHGPRIISQAEADRLQAAQEQEQIRLDNAAIQSQIDQAIDSWTRSQQQQQQARNDEEMGRWMDQQSQLLTEQLASLKQSIQTALNIDELTASLQCQIEALRRQNEAETKHQIEALRRQNEAETKHQIEALRRQNEAGTKHPGEALRRENEAVRQQNEAGTKHPGEAPRRSNEAPRRSNADVLSSSRHEAVRPPAGIGLLRLPSGDRAAQKAEALRLVDSGISTYKAAEQTGIPSGTIQRWLKERKEESESKTKEA